MFSEVCLKYLNVIYLLERILFEVRPFLVALPYFADSFSKPTWCVSMKFIKMTMISFSEIKWNKVHQNSSLTLFDKVFFMASNFSVIPIRWLLTIDSEMAFFPFPFAR